MTLSPKKHITVIALFAITAFILCNALYLWAYSDVSSLKPWVLGTDYEDADVEYWIDEVKRVEGSLVIRGWALVPGEPISQDDYDTDARVSRWNNRIVLRDNRSGEYYEMPTQKQRRADLTRHFNNLDGGSEHYDSGGFYSSAIFDGDLSNYTFFLSYRSNGHNALIEIGQLKYHSPKEAS